MGVLRNSVRAAIWPQLALSVAAVLLAGEAAAREPAPITDATDRPSQVAAAAPAAKPKESVEERLSRIERQLQNQTLLDMAQKLGALQSEVQKLRGILEEQTHEIETTKKRQRDLYVDMDRRLSQLERAVPSGGTPVPPDAASTSGPAADAAAPAAASPPVASTAGAEGASAGDSQQEQTAYLQAFNRLKEGRYEQAIAEFKAFLARYPNGIYSDNGTYWLGEAYYVSRQFPQALQEFERVIANPNSRKRSDALLKIGYAHYELGDWAKAHAALEQLIGQYSGTSVARLAEQRLERMKQEGR